MTRIRTAVVGLGYWGPNLARNFQMCDEYELVALCDKNEKRLDRLGESYPWAKRYVDMDAMLAASKLDLVAVVTPVATHYAAVKAALSAGAHVLCEKPLASSVSEAEELVGLAARSKLHLFVDHTFTYLGAVRALREAYTGGLLGELLYIDSVRINLGLFQPDVDVIWDLAPHDVSIISYILGETVATVRATGTSHNPSGLVDVAYLDLTYESGMTAHLHLSWLSPVKVRRMILSGSRSSVIFDDLELSEKIKIYDHGVTFDKSDIDVRKQVLVNYRRGDMRAPAIDNKEALATEVREIAAHIQGLGRAAALGRDGLDIVRVLDACKQSLAIDGARVAL